MTHQLPTAVAADGGVFTFGDATFHGSTGAITLNQPIVGIAATPTGRGYWLAAADGGVFTFGNARYHGAAAGTFERYVGIARTTTGNGYWLITATDTRTPYGDAS